MPIEPFYMVIEDEDRRLFTVQGPMVDDRWRINHLSELRSERRNVRCHHVEQALTTREALIADTTARTGYQFVESLGI